jgi:hypothetical protein
MPSAERISRVRVTMCRSLELYISYCLELESSDDSGAGWGREARFAESAKRRINTRMQAMVIAAAGGESTDTDLPAVKATKARVAEWREKVQAALLGAFNEAELKQMVKFGLGFDLEEIAGGATLEEKVFNLVAWSERTGRQMQLVSAAQDVNSENLQLRSLTASWAGN